MEVTVYGQDFAKGKLVDIYYGGTSEDDRVATTRTDSGGDFTIPFTVPEGCQGAYKVHAVVLDDTVDTYFSVKPGLTVSPEKGPVGTNVTVEGRGFAKNEGGIELRYDLGDTYEMIASDIEANAKGSWERSFPIPISNRGEHKLEAEGTVSRIYEVRDATFRVTAEISLDKQSGTVGERITMTGSQFAANERDIKILFDGEAVDVDTNIKVNSTGDWEASFEVPEMPASEYSVTAEGAQTKVEDIIERTFEIKPDLVLSPDGGYVGIDLTVTGHGFAANKDVVIMYEGSQKETATTNDKGSFDATFIMPESKYGAHQVKHQVTAEDTTGNNAAATFTMESEPPDTPTLISPPKKGRVGFVGKVTPTFEWSEVPDESGVRYRLQIATSADVAATGFVDDPTFSIEGLVETSYTLNETDALDYGTYYWIVQAVDGAGNAGSWTPARSFRAGLLPLWGLIAAIAAAVVLLVALIRALVRRRSIYYDRW